MINRVLVNVDDVNLNLREYELQIWTLLDAFIGVLKHFNSDARGIIEEPHMILSDDGTEELTFNIPMYIRLDGRLIENPIWYNTRNGNLIASMRKIKVIFRETDTTELIFEFIITQVEEAHNEGTLMCSVSCEGLAFHELGKVGYKLELSSDVFLDQYNEWFDNKKGEEPVNNLLYWMEDEEQLHIPYLPDKESKVDPRVWYYKIDMNWDSYIDSAAREPNKVYEEGYVSSYDTEETNGEFLPKTVIPPHEMTALLDEADSNIYNLTLALAEKFRVYCRYEYGHDEHYHITSRTIIFYNNFIKEQEGALGFIYPYSTKEVTRAMDSTDIITKMYVHSMDDDEEVINIMDAEANKSREDYVFNFDYLYKIGAVDEEILNDVKKHENELRKLNLLLIPLQEKLATYLDRLNEINASLTLIENAIANDIKILTLNNDLINALDLKDGNLDNAIPVTNLSPKAAVVTQDKSGKFVISISEKGVIYNTLLVYASYDFSNKTASDPILKIKGEYDEYRNLVKVYVAKKPTGMVYLTYDYLPKLYWDNIQNTWNNKLEKDKAEEARLLSELSIISHERDLLKSNIKATLSLKLNLISKFNTHLGPALREGYWTPDDYKNCEDKYIESFLFPSNTETVKNGSSTFFSAMWDTVPFDGELNNTYKLGINETLYYYPLIDLTGEISEDILNFDTSFVLVYYDYEKSQYKPYELSNATLLGINSSIYFATVAYGTTYKPVLIITAADKMSDDELALLKANGYIGKITASNTSIGSSSYFEVKQAWVEQYHVYLSVYPRIVLNTTAIKTDELSLRLKYNDKLLTNYEDYTVLYRDGKTYITIKPEVFIHAGGYDKLIELLYTVSRASTAIYLDAKAVIKENALPQVTYTIKPSVFNLQFMHLAYKSLGRIVNVNDTLLKFENVLGYISKLDLDLDAPWDDSIEVKNYKTKFEDIFTSIVASTEAMKKNANLYTTTANMFNTDGTIKGSVLLNSIFKADLNYAFNNGTLTIDQLNGIWGISESGVVALRGGGIFTATEKDEAGNWVWNTGILPQGINAELITAGLLDTNKVVIYAGDLIRFLLNESGLYAYKSVIEDKEFIGDISAHSDQFGINDTDYTINQFFDENYPNGVDMRQYVMHNADGLFLRAEKDAIVKKLENNKLILKHLDLTINRVAIDWNGFTLRNWENQITVQMAADTGNVDVIGTVTALTFKAKAANSNFIANGTELGFYHLDNTPILTIGANGTISAAESLKISAGESLSLLASSDADETNGVIINKDGVSISGAKLIVDTSNFKLDSELKIFKLFATDLNNASVDISTSGIIIQNDGDLKVDTTNFKLDSGLQIFKLFVDKSNTPSIDISTAGITIQSGGNLDINTDDFILDSANNIIEFKSNSKSIVKINNSGVDINTTNLILNSTSSADSPSLLLKNNGKDVFNFSKGDLTITGKITATELYVGTGDSLSMTYKPSEGLQITKGSITIGTTTINENTVPVFKVDENGNLTAHNGTFDGNINGSIITGGSINIPATSPKFTVDKTGKVTAMDLNITGGEINVNDNFIVTTGGVMTAKGATIDGTVYATELNVGSKKDADDSLGTSFMTYSSANGLKIGDNDAYLEYKSDTLTVKGNIEATGGTFSGNITANGTIEGGTISGAAISGGTINVPATNSLFTVDKDGNVTASSLNITGGSITIGRTFSVDLSGILNATSATFSGTITASNIYMGGDNTASNNLFSVSDSGHVTANSITIGSDDNILTYDGQTLSVTGDINATTGTFSGDVKGATIKGGSINVPATDPLFSVTSAGAVTATSITIGSDSKGKLTYTSNGGLVVSTNSKLGNWTIGDDYLYNDTTTGAGFGIGNPATKQWTFVVDKSGLKFGSNFSVSGGGSIICGGVTTAQLNITGGILKGTLSGDTFTVSENFITDNWTGDINFSGAVTVNTLKTNNTTVKLITAMNTDSNGYVTSMTIGGLSVNFTKATDFTLGGEGNSPMDNHFNMYVYKQGTKLTDTRKALSLEGSSSGYNINLIYNSSPVATISYANIISAAVSDANPWLPTYASDDDLSTYDNDYIKLDTIISWSNYSRSDYILLPKSRLLELLGTNNE